MRALRKTYIDLIYVKVEKDKISLVNLGAWGGWKRVGGEWRKIYSSTKTIKKRCYLFHQGFFFGSQIMHPWFVWLPLNDSALGTVSHNMKLVVMQRFEPQNLL